MSGPTFTLIVDTVEFINHYAIIPLTILTFSMLMYFVIYIRMNDPDIIKSKLFLRFDEFKNAFTILAFAAFVLIFHVLFIYLHNIIDMSSMLELLVILSKIQQLLGLILTILLLFFASRLFKVVK
ncbi:MAG: hypothetical protein SCH39_12735 [Methanosarcinales archaeon]|nr:hypothetical protein [ANME-2 cluster archaeon]MDW7777183.1 hypothetical protein [Methanosarcinales archaeon]